MLTAVCTNGCKYKMRHSAFKSCCAEIKVQSSHAAKEAAVKPSRISKSNLQKPANPIVKKRDKANSYSHFTDVTIHSTCEEVRSHHCTAALVELQQPIKHYTPNRNKVATRSLTTKLQFRSQHHAHRKFLHRQRTDGCICLNQRPARRSLRVVVISLAIKQ